MSPNSMRHVLNRRSFLRTALAGGSGCVLAGNRVAVLAAGGRDLRALIDTHTHFYDPARPQGVPWPNQDDKFLYRTILPAEYKSQPTPAPVTGTIVVEASSWIEDNQWVLDLAAKDRFIVGFVGHLPMGTPDFVKHLRRFSKNPLFRGIRIGATLLSQRLGDAGFGKDLRRLAEADLALDVLGGAEMLVDISRMARRIPALRIVIDHVANVKIDGKPPPDDWLQGIRAAAQGSNVYCKISGLVEGTGRIDGLAPKETSFYEPVLNAVWEAFGEERLIYGSNWPVSARFAQLSTVQAIIADYSVSKGAGIADKIFSKNAKGAYKWRDRSEL